MVARAEDAEAALNERLGEHSESRRDLPRIRIEGATELIDFDTWRWYDASKSQLVATMTLTQGQVYRITFAFYAGKKLITTDALPGSIFQSAGDTQIRRVPGPSSMHADGTFALDRVGEATHVLVTIVPVRVTEMLASQPEWVRAKAAGCERAVLGECEALIAAFRDGNAYNRVNPDADLAAHFSKRLAAVGEDGCNGGQLWSCFLLGTAYIDGADIPRNVERGRKLVRKACAGGLRSACAWEVENHLPSPISHKSPEPKCGALRAEYSRASSAGYSPPCSSAFPGRGSDGSASHSGR